jgi:hypothetical protein
MFNAWAFSADSSPTLRGYGNVSNIKPPSQPYCPSTSITIYDQNFLQQVRVYDLHSSPGSHSGEWMAIVARSLSYGGYWNSRTVGAYDSSSCGGAVHVMTWFDGLVPGVINIVAHDNYANCQSSGWNPGFYFPCFSGAGEWYPPHDLSDWNYVSQWNY